MGYSAENYRAVKELLDTRRAEAVRESERRRAELHQKSPEVAEIDRALRKTGMALFRAACQGGKDAEPFLRVMAENKALQESRAELLASLGLPADYTEVHYTCQACGDTGYVDINMCTCMKRELTLAGFRSSGLGALLQRQTFDNFSLDFYAAEPENLRLMERTLAMAREYAEGFTLHSGNLIFFGRTGLGKTHLSTAIAREVIVRGYDVRYDSLPNILSDFEFDRYKSSYKEESLRAEKYLTCDLLIMDDLGTEVVNQFTLSCLYNIINTRLCAERPTIISTHLGEDALQERYHDRITSRLLGEYRPLIFVGEDIRMQKLK